MGTADCGDAAGLREQRSQHNSRCTTFLLNDSEYVPLCRAPESATRDIEQLDRQIDRDEMDIDALVLRILALRQFAAHDLRSLVTALKLVMARGEDVRHART